MSAAYEPHAETVRNHWWWRPGWRIGRRYYTWHLTFEGQHDLHRLVAEYLTQLSNIPGVDLVPRDWLHLTMQGIGFADEVADADVNQIAANAKTILADIPDPVRITFSQATVRKEAIALVPSPLEPIRAIRKSIREAIARVWGDANVPGSANHFEPHVSLAYFNIDGSRTPFVNAVEQARPEPALVELREASLIVLDRDAQMYRWKTYARASLSTEGRT